jgi:hypothetical protein
MNLSISILSVIGLAVGKAFEVSSHVPFLAHRNLYDRHLVEGLDECINKTEAIGEEIVNRGGDFKVNIQCDNSNYCETDARDAYLYDNFLTECLSLNGENYTFNMVCDFGIEIDGESGINFIQFRWNNMPLCMDPVCDTTEVVDLISSYYGGGFTSSTGDGLEFKSVSCYAQNLRDSDDTVIVEGVIPIDVSLHSSAMRSLEKFSTFVLVTIALLSFCL